MSNTYTVTNNQPIHPRVWPNKELEEITDSEKELLRKVIGNYIDGEK